MDRLRIYGWAATGVALAGLGRMFSSDPGFVSKLSAEMLSRSVGLALLGIALVGTGIVFRAAMCSGEKPAAPTMPMQASEYRRGFADRGPRTKAQSMRRAAVVSLRRAVEEQGRAPPAIATGTTFPTVEMKRLQDRLHNRVVRTVGRHVDMG